MNSSSSFSILKKEKMKEKLFENSYSVKKIGKS